MARRYIEKYWSSVPLEDNSVHLIPRIGVMTPAMIPPLKQSQRLRRELLYMPIDKAREKGTLKKLSNTSTLLSSNSSYSNFRIGDSMAGATPVTIFYLPEKKVH